MLLLPKHKRQLIAVALLKTEERVQTEAARAQVEPCSANFRAYAEAKQEAQTLKRLFAAASSGDQSAVRDLVAFVEAMPT